MPTILPISRKLSFFFLSARIWLFRFVFGNDIHTILSCVMNVDKIYYQHMPRNNVRHGLEGTRFCNVYRGIQARTGNPSELAYKNYGGRGIKNHWPTLLDFKNDMYASYLKHVEDFGEKETTIDRIDVDGDYSPENCRWATRKEQGNNTRANRIITYGGKTQNLTQWAEEYGLTTKQLHKRLDVQHKTMDEALFPVRNLRIYPYGDELLSLPELSERTGIKYATLYRRIVISNKPLELAISKKVKYGNS